MTKRSNVSRNFLPLLTLSIGLIFFLFIIISPVLASPTGPWWERDICWCDNELEGHYHHCQASEQTDFNCAIEDLGYSTHCQDNTTNETCSEEPSPWT